MYLQVCMCTPIFLFVVFTYRCSLHCPTQDSCPFICVSSLGLAKGRRPALLSFREATASTSAKKRRRWFGMRRVNLANVVCETSVTYAKCREPLEWDVQYTPAACCSFLADFRLDRVMRAAMVLVSVTAMHTLISCRPEEI